MPEPLDIRDLGIGKLREALAELGRTRITFGYQGPSGAAAHPEAGGASVALVAAWMEFGTPDAPFPSPARPLGRHTMEANRDAFAAAAKRAIADVIDGRATPEIACERVGDLALRALRKTIDRSREWAKANAASTIRAKGHDQPLVGGTGTLYDQASWAVRVDGKIVRQGGEG